MKNRNTLQRRLVLETVRRMHNHPTADEIFREISAENSLISKATVYRNLKILSEQGEILHIPIPDGADCFDFNTTPHYHLECRGCGRVFDVNMPYQTCAARSWAARRFWWSPITLFLRGCVLPAERRRNSVRSSPANKRRKQIWQN